MRVKRKLHLSKQNPDFFRITGNNSEKVSEDLAVDVLFKSGTQSI